MKFSILSYGDSSLGGVFLDLDEKEGIRAVHTGVNHGINFIDISLYYGFKKVKFYLEKH
jgi:aryl-alcohol dehydrogenase-like predicted oxidoreductase